MQKIRIVSPAKHIEKTPIKFAANYLRESGYNVEIGRYAMGQHHYFSGTIEERVSDFQEALDDESVDVILCSRGGYGCVQLLDHLDFSKFKAHPKLVVGYSDVTVFHCHISSHYKLPTIHATAPLNFAENTVESLESLINALENKANKYVFAGHPLNQNGQVTAEIIGGNLAILHSLIGTDSDPDYTGKILFVEEIGEAVYSIDRMFYSFKKSGKLDQIKGLIVGGLTHVKDSEIPYGKTAEEVISHHLDTLNIPVCFNFPTGHIADNRAIIIGREAELSISKSEVVFTQ